MNKQQMIDKAIEDLKGVYPIGSRLNYLIRSTVYNTCWGEGKYEVYQYPDLIGSKWRHICTRKEFEDRVEELNNMKTSKEWDGDGLPPVGANITIKGIDRVDLSEHGEGFIGKSCEVMATFRNCNNIDMVAVQKDDGACACFILKLCVPIKTEKELTIEKAHEIVEKVYTSCDKPFLEALYDAGMLVNPKSRG